MIDSAIVVAILGGGAIALRLLWSTSSDPRLDEVWKTAARRVGGVFEVAKGRFLRPAVRRMELTTCGVPMVVRTDRRRAGNSYVYYTRALSGALPAAGITRIHCVKRDLVLKLSKRLGLASLLTGHAEFDDVVHMSGSPTSIVRAFLDGATRRLIAEHGNFDIEDGRLFLDREGIPMEADSLVAMVRFAEQLVDRWCTLLRGLTRLAESFGLALEPHFDVGGSPALIASGIHRSHSTTLSLRVTDELMLTVVAFEATSAGEWTMERDDSDVFRFTGEPPEPVRAFGEVAPESLLGVRGTAGSLELAFDGVAPAQDEVRTSLDAMIDAAAARAPYR